MPASAIVLHNQEVVPGEHHDDRNFYVSENQWDVEDQNANPTRCLANSNKSSSPVRSNLDPLRGVSMQSLEKLQ